MLPECYFYGNVLRNGEMTLQFGDDAALDDFELKGIASYATGATLESSQLPNLNSFALLSGFSTKVSVFDPSTYPINKVLPLNFKACCCSDAHFCGAYYKSIGMSAVGKWHWQPFYSEIILAHRLTNVIAFLERREFRAFPNLFSPLDTN